MTVRASATRAAIVLNGAPAPFLHLVRCESSLGGRRLDTAIVEFDPAGTGGFLHDVELKEGLYGLSLAVVLPISGGTRTVHWGKISEQRPALGDRQAVHLVSRLEPHHFGEPLRGRLTRTKLAGGRIVANFLDRPVVFNPTVDGATRNNRSKHKNRWGSYFFVDELSTYTEKSRQWQEEEEETAAWSLADAVHYLCTTLNPFQTHLQNPTRTGLDQALAGSKERLRDIRIPDGLFLPQALDRLLEPFNYVWFVQHDSPTVRRLRFVRKGSGATGVVGYQRAGEDLDLEQTNVQGLDLQFDTSKLVNKVTVTGDLLETECTVELVRAWSENNDELEQTDLALNGEGYSDNPDYRRVWRDWVLNESADYVKTRPEIKKPFDLGTIFDNDQYTLRRRKFLPCLTQDTGGGPIGNVQGVQVQWWDEASEEWLGIEDLSDAGSRVVHILERECGIRFAGELPPFEIMSQGENAKVRVTAVLRADKRLEATSREPDSVSPEAVPILVSLPDKFRKRVVHDDSIYREEIDDGGLLADEVDDTDAIQEMADELVAAFNQADCRGSIALTGLTHNFRLGECIRAVHGRAIGLGLSKTRTRYPQIAGISYEEATQRMTLQLETFYDDVQVE